MVRRCGTTGEPFRKLLKKARLFTSPTLEDISPSRPEFSKTASSPWDAPCSKQGRSERPKTALPSLLVIIVLFMMARMGSPLRASNEGLLKPRVARAQEFTGPSRPLLADLFSILLGVRAHQHIYERMSGGCNGLVWRGQAWVLFALRAAQEIHGSGWLLATA